jgi:hypothetical protein
MFIKTASLSAALALALFAPAPAMAQDAMGTAKMSSDGMAMDAMAPMMSDEDLKVCIDQAKAITFAEVAMAAEAACHDVHNGHDAMGGDAMMGGEAMAPKQ